MEHSHRKIHLSTDVLLETFKFLLKNDLRKCRKVAPQWNLVIRQNKHMLCQNNPDAKDSICCDQVLEAAAKPGSLSQVSKSIRELLLNDEVVNRKKLIEEFSMIDDSGFVFDLVSEGIADFRATNEIGGALVFMAAKILYCLSSKELLNQLEVGTNICTSLSSQDITRRAFRNCWREHAPVSKQRRRSYLKYKQHAV
uniref:F-box domain-containing protein n=1 Tax=Ditylenchus dipsaci TaxID=166011 RepID=A0A915CWX0_9BILA